MICITTINPSYGNMNYEVLITSRWMDSFTLRTVVCVNGCGGTLAGVWRSARVLCWRKGVFFLPEVNV